MTNEKALQILELAQAEVEWEHPLEYYIAFETAAVALNKQIPVPVDYHYSSTPPDGFLYDAFSCPSCGRKFQSGIDTCNYAYCPYCGQAMKIELTAVCPYYSCEDEIQGWITPQTPIRKLVSRCTGTKEKEVCSCDGDESRCNFYPAKRKQHPNDITTNTTTKETTHNENMG